MSTRDICAMDMLCTFVVYVYTEKLKIIPVRNISMHFRVSRIWDAISLTLRLISGYFNISTKWKVRPVYALNGYPVGFVLFLFGFG